jgi:hypothetical protein
MPDTSHLINEQQSVAGTVSDWFKAAAGVTEDVWAATAAKVHKR